MYFLIGTVCAFLIYKYRKRIAIKIFSMYVDTIHFFENSDFINNNIKTFNNSISFFNFETNKTIEENKIKCDDGFISIYRNGKTKYLEFKNIDYYYKKGYDYLDYNTPKLFSSVTLSINEEIIDCEDILNNFVLPEIILSLNETMAKIILKLKNLDYQKQNYNSLSWSVITNKAKIYTGNKIIFTIDKNYNLRK